MAHTLTASEIPAITSSGGALSVSTDTTNSNNVIGSIINEGTGGGGFGFEALSGASNAVLPSTGTTSNQSVTSNNTGGVAHENAQPTILLNKLLRIA